MVVCILQYHLCTARRQHNGRRIGIARCYIRKTGRINDTQCGDTMNPEVGIQLGVPPVVVHTTRARSVIHAVRIRARTFKQLIVVHLRGARRQQLAGYRALLQPTVGGGLWSLRHAPAGICACIAGLRRLRRLVWYHLATIDGDGEVIEQ